MLPPLLCTVAAIAARPTYPYMDCVNELAPSAKTNYMN